MTSIPHIKFPLQLSASSYEFFADAILREFGSRAALLYAPQSETDPLENLGSVVLPDGVLENGASLVTPGLIDGAAAVSLDGTDDYIDTGWETRTNLAPNPSLETNTIGYRSDGAAGAPERLNTGWTLKDGTWHGRYVAASAEGGTPGAFIGGTDYFGPGLIPAKPGVAYSIRWAFAGDARPKIIRLTFQDAEANTLAFYDVVVPAGFDGDLEWVNKVAPAKTVGISLTIYQGETKGAVDVSFDALLVEAAPIVGSYFPTPAQLESGEAAKAPDGTWDIGPFARGAKRTFVMMSNRATDSGFGPLVQGGEAQEPLLYYDTASDQILFRTQVAEEAKYAVMGDGPAVGQNALLAFVNDRVNDEAALTINGVAGERLSAPQAIASSGALTIGGDAFSFNGSLGPFVVFLGELSTEEIAEVNRFATQPRLLKAATVATVEQDSPEEIEQSALSILSTTVGSRIDEPAFGVPDLTFTRQQVRPSADVYVKAIEEWEPRAAYLGEAEVEGMIERIVLREVAA